MKFTDTVRERIYARADWRCDLCGSRVTVGHVHHRKPRRMGGSKDAVLGSCANGVLLHPNCHATIESRRGWALTTGWLVPSHADPREVPVRHWRGWVRLTEEGSLQPVTDIKELADLAVAERVALAPAGGFGPDEPLDGPLADAQPDSGDVAGGPGEVGVVADRGDDAGQTTTDGVHQGDDKG